MRKLTIIATFITLLSIIISCEKDVENNIQDEIIGTWQLTSVKIDGIDTSLLPYTDIIQFQANRIFQAYDTTTHLKDRGGWSYKNEMLSISIYLPAAYYIVQAETQKLTLKRFDFNNMGTLNETIFNYQRTSDTIIP